MTSKQDSDSQKSHSESLGGASCSIDSSNQNDSSCSLSNHASEHWKSEFSGNQWELRILGSYLCDLMYLKKLGKTSLEENEKIVLLDHYLKHDRSHPKEMRQKVCHWVVS